jgi:hypothetical protein
LTEFEVKAASFKRLNAIKKNAKKATLPHNMANCINDICDDNNNASVKPIATIAMIFVVNSKFFHSTKVNNSNTSTANMAGGW